MNHFGLYALVNNFTDTIGSLVDLKSLYNIKTNYYDEDMTLDDIAAMQQSIYPMFKKGTNPLSQFKYGSIYRFPNMENSSLSYFGDAIIYETIPWIDKNEFVEWNMLTKK